MKHATFNPGFPVYIYEEGMELPKEGTYFLVSGNGLWLHKDTGIVRAFVPVDNISVLQELSAEAWVECKLPKLPFKFVWQIQQFFKKVVKKHRSEATTTLYYSKDEEKFKVHIPKQLVSHSGVQYRRSGLTGLEGLESYLPVMTIHSHCDFGAFHSDTDIGDEKDFDGVHCTFGHNNKNEFTISASVVVNGTRLKVDPMKVLEGIAPVRIEEKASWGSKEHFFQFSAPPQPEWDEPIDRWFTKVKPHNFPQLGLGLGLGLVDLGFEKGDQVDWAGSLSTVSFRNTCGEGPFTVDEVDGDQITVNTKIGLARFSDKLFRKVKDGDETN